MYQALRLALVFGFFYSTCHAADQLRFDAEFFDKTKTSRSTIDSNRIEQVRDFLVFVGAHEIYIDAQPRWYDLVSFDCRTGEFKVLLANRLKDQLRTLAELQVYKATGQEDAQAFGSLHDWPGMVSLSAMLQKRCGRSPRSTYKYLPYQFGETTESIWWIDLANITVSGPNRKFFLFTKQFAIETRVVSGTELQRLVFKRGTDVTFHWSADCRKSTVTMLSSTRYGPEGDVLEDHREPSPEQVALPNTIGRQALDFACKLRN